MATSTATATCNATAPVTAGGGARDTGTCYRPAGHAGEHDYQVEPPTVVQPWSPGDRHPSGLLSLDQVERRGETVVRDCGWCPYGIDYHILTPGGFACPTEDQARAMAGDR
jgi:hypothetical protein